MNKNIRMGQYTCAVVIPYYTNDLTQNEMLSLDRVRKVLCEYEIILVTPESLKVTCEHATGLRQETFDDRFFTGLPGYNRLMITKEFYERFSFVDYILICQLDAYVVSDQLSLFMDYDFDYIGAPWIRGLRTAVDYDLPPVWFVGNGGFSLRKIKAFLQILEKQTSFDKDVFEDVFWSSRNCDSFTVAPVDVAVRFSFERDVRKCYEMTGKQLPFGVHKWEKYCGSFWKDVIEGHGYRVDTDALEERDNIAGHDYDFPQILLHDQALAMKQLFCGNTEKPIYIWGCRVDGRECLWLLKKYGYPVAGIVDSNEERWGDSILGVSVLSPDRIGEKEGVIIIAARRHEEEIYRNIRERRMGFNILLYSDFLEAFRKNADTDS